MGSSQVTTWRVYSLLVPRMDLEGAEGACRPRKGQSVEIVIIHGNHHGSHGWGMAWGYDTFMVWIWFPRDLLLGA